MLQHRPITAVFVLAALLCARTERPSVAAETDLTAGAQFSAAGSLVKLADDARDTEDAAGALGYYVDALETYQRLAVQYPHWQPKITRFQILYCQQQIRMLNTHADPLPQAGSPSTLAAGRTEPDAGEPLKRQARAQILNHDPFTARETLLQAMKKAPDDVEVRLLMALVQCQAGFYDDALFMVDNLLEEQPPTTNILLIRATALLGLGDTQGAVATLEEILKSDPDSSEAHYNLARILKDGNRGSRMKALTHYHLAVELGGDRDPELEAILGN